MANPAFCENFPNLAAVLYRREDDIDSILAGFALDQVRAGRRIGGVVQRNGASGDPHGRMQMIDLMTGRTISICQQLGPESQACKLDPAGLVTAAVAVSQAVAAQVELVVVNKFSKQEAAGAGLRAELAEAVAAGLPVLTAVPEKFLAAWTDFTGGLGSMLTCDRPAIEAWWREAGRRAHQWHAAAGAAAIAT